MIATQQLRSKARAFTLIELLVVMAISSILLGLIFGPMVQSFNLTTRARVQVLAQATARRTMLTIQADLLNSVYVFDNTNQPINFWVKGQAAPIPIYYACMDVVPPAHVNDNNPAMPIDPTTGLPMESLRGAVSRPLSPGRVIVRYWVGLRDNTSVNGAPVKPYYNYYDDPQHTGTPNDQNTMVLYRAVVMTTVKDNNGNYVPDRRFFRTGANGIIQYDPNFFYDSTAAPGGLSPIPGWSKNNNGYGTIAENWKAIAEPVVPIDRADEAVVQHDAAGNPDYTTISSIVRFQPTYFAADTAVLSSTGDAADEQPNDVSPSSCTFSNGYWTSPFMAYVYTSFPGDVYTWNGSGNLFHNGADTGFDPTNPTIADPTKPPGVIFSVNPRRGMINFVFPDSIINGNSVQTYDAHSDVNRWKTLGWSDLRFISLRWQHQTDADPAAGPPVPPLPATNLSPFGLVTAANGNYRIVPGSEVVTGPDMTPGLNHGKPIIYTRVNRLSDPKKIGPNEYMINYVDQANGNNANPIPVDRVGTIIFDSQDDPAGVAPQHALPEGVAPITVTYQLQANRTWYVVKSDYLTRQLMTFGLGVRLYEFHTGQPQQVDLSRRLSLSNLLR